MLVAQITDLHITTSRRDGLSAARNAHRLGEVVRALNALDPQPTLVLGTGDLVDRGEEAEYDELKGLLADLRAPLRLLPGNHDRRAPLAAIFGGTTAPADEDGFAFVQERMGGLTVIGVDTLQEGEAGGAFCEPRARRLARALDEAAGAPVLLALHHPPVRSGVPWMDPPPGAEWVRRLAAVLAGRNGVRALLAGHVHRAFVSPFAGSLVSVAPAVSHQLALDFHPLDPRRPDGRTLLRAEPPGYALVHWDDGDLAIHTCIAGAHEPAVVFSRPMG